jgi:hypothetical protein
MHTRVLTRRAALVPQPTPISDRLSGGLSGGLSRQAIRGYLRARRAEIFVISFGSICDVRAVMLCAPCTRGARSRDTRRRLSQIGYLSLSDDSLLTGLASSRFLRR